MELYLAILAGVGDLTLHFGAGFILSALILLIFGRPVAARRQDWVVLTAVGASILLGVAKEAGDYYLGWGTPEIADLTLTWSGGVAALVVIALIDEMVFLYKNRR